MATIGIKIANGEFYAILEESSGVKKRLILTTVHDSQKSVQIDLYKSAAKTMADAAYIGSLVVENIKAAPKGEPSIELTVSCTPEGEISADVSDMDAPAGTGSHHLSVSLQTIEENSRDYDIPDFELDSQEAPPSGLYDRASAAREKDSEKKFPWLLLVILLGILLILGGLIWYFLFRPKSAEQPASARPPAVESPAPSSLTPSETVQSAPPAQPAREAQGAQQQPAPPPVIQAPAAPPKPADPPRRDRPPAPVSSYKVPESIPRAGIPYKIRWGDTLWDISEAFYRNPWLYPRIARFNKIRNPDFIISGTTIRIPPRN